MCCFGRTAYCLCSMRILMILMPTSQNRWEDERVEHWEWCLASSKHSWLVSLQHHKCVSAMTCGEQQRRTYTCEMRMCPETQQSKGEKWWSRSRGIWEAQLVKCLPSAHVIIPGSWDQVPHRGPCSVGILLLFPPTCALTCSLTNNWMKSLKKNLYN